MPTAFFPEFPPSNSGDDPLNTEYSREYLAALEARDFKPLSPYSDNQDDGPYLNAEPPIPDSDLEYDPLPRPRWIRVLKLDPGYWFLIIRCSLIHVSLDDERLNYEALSYTWGDPKRKTFIVCNGTLVRIQQSLYDALRFFRHPRRGRLIWADGLCINQGDLEEKSYQVQLMRDIYSRASRVLVSLGDPGEGKNYDYVRNAVELSCRIVAQEYGAVEKDTGRPASYVDSLSYVGCERHRRRGPVTLTPDTLRPLVPLFSCPWFTRIWVYQEVALASSATLFWGSYAVDFDWVALTAVRLEEDLLSTFHDHSIALPGLRNCAMMHRTSRGQTAHLSFFDLLRNTDHFNATDARDKVYALIGLATKDADPSEGEFFIEPDYKLSEYEVYERVARKCLLELRIADVLCMVEHPDSEPILPWQASWVPDFSRKTFAQPFPHAVFRAHGDTQPQIRPADDAKSTALSISGIEVDVIAEVLNALDPDTVGDDTATAERLKQLVRTLQTKTDFETIALLLTAGMDLDLKAAVSDLAARISELIFFLACNPSALAPETPVEPPSDSDSEYSADRDDTVAAAPPPDAVSGLTTDLVTIGRRFSRASSVCLQARSIFITKKGMLGLGPEVVQVEDVVAVLFGSGLPILLRPKGEQYQVFGACYVHGIMEGQVVREWEESGEPRKEFILV